MSWPIVNLGSVAQINPRLPKDTDESQLVTFLKMASVSEQGELLTQESRVLSETKKGFTYFEKNDILVAKITPCFENGKATLLSNLKTKIGFGSTEFHVIRAHADQIDAKYLFYLVWNKQFRFLGKHAMKGAAGQQRISSDFLKKLKIPLPPLETQKQIAAVLEQADQLRKDCQQMERELNSLAQSVFIDMFGDPVSNPRGWDVKPLRELVSVLSGATPSKSNDEYWLGEIPWVSPKDMKITEISNSLDHVNELAFDETNLKRIPLNSILVVVRGMILAHTVPLAITRKEVAINQDIKSMTVKTDAVKSDYLLGTLLSMHSKILSIVSSAAHGTKRIDANDLCDLGIIVPSLDLQDKYISALEIIREMKNTRQQAAILYEKNFNALMQKAFKGELNLDKSAT